MHAPEESFLLIDGANSGTLWCIVRIADRKDFNAFAISNKCIHDSM
jgi:hypothetical protein